MKRFIVITILLLASTADAEWDKTDTALQATYTVLHIIDWGQTRWIAKNPYIYNDKTFTTSYGEIIHYSDSFKENPEANFILGRHPSVNKVNIYFASTLIAHTTVSYILPKKYRTYWQLTTIGFESAVIGHNFKAGIKFEF